MDGHIYIYGEIDSNWGVGAANVQKQIVDNKDSENFIVHINSPGGDVSEGWAIHDILQNSGKPFTTMVEGICASIASIIFLASENRLMTENSELMIHNPFGFVGGTAKDLEKYTEQLKAVEDKLISYYSTRTGNDIETITSMMNNETFMSASESIEKGFATGFTERIKAVAKLNINHKKENEMDETKLNGFLAKLDALFTNVGKKFGFKNLMVQDANGKNLDFGTQIEQAEQIAVGMTAVYEDGTKPVGEVVMPDGSILVFDDSSTITEIKPMEGTPDNAELEALKSENETLKAELEALKSVDIEAKSKMKAEKMIKEYKAEITSKYVALIEERDEKQDPQDQPKKFVFGGKKQN